jgi:Zn finger protein HypA/HybF involved in hydrogenase expression
MKNKNTTSSIYFERIENMSAYFYCSDCQHVSPDPKDNTKCPDCGSIKGRMMSDDEFNRKEDIGAINLINPSTGKPFKKKKHK